MEYETDNDALFQAVQEEAHYWRTVHDLKELVETVGLTQVLVDLSTVTGKIKP